jgi:hypothetical protein
MTTKLVETLQSYITKAKETVGNTPGNRQGSDGRSTNSALVASVDTLETSPAFSKAVAIAEQMYRKDDDLHIVGQYDHLLQTFFRRSGLYLALANGEAVSVRQYADVLDAAFRTGATTVTHLVPLQFFEISSARLAWSDLELRRFSQPELDTLLDNKTNEIFFPYARVDTSKLEQYWHLRVTDTVNAEPTDLGGSPFIKSHVRISYSRFPAVVEQALQQLALYDWQIWPSKERPRQYEQWHGPSLPDLPFVLTATDSLLRRPSRCPDLSTLVTEPFIDSQTGEELGEVPARGLYFDAAETESLREFLSRNAELLHTVAPHSDRYAFVYTALGFLVKAFTTEGIEQLLWHMTAIEAILGQKGEALVQLLKRRIANVIGGSTTQRKSLRKQFDALYGFRSDLVHGNSTGTAKVYEGHLSEARDIAREIALWALQLIAHVIKTHEPGGPDLPDRSMLLALSDWDRAQWAQMKAVVKTLPANFPEL